MAINTGIHTNECHVSWQVFRPAEGEPAAHLFGVLELTTDGGQVTLYFRDLDKLREVIDKAGQLEMELRAAGLQTVETDVFG